MYFFCWPSLKKNVRQIIIIIFFYMNVGKRYFSFSIQTACPTFSKVSLWSFYGESTLKSYQQVLVHQTYSLYYSMVCWKTLHPKKIKLGHRAILCEAFSRNVPYLKRILFYLRKKCFWLAVSQNNFGHGL